MSCSVKAFLPWPRAFSARLAAWDIAMLVGGWVGSLGARVELLRGWEGVPCESEVLLCGREVLLRGREGLEREINRI